MSRTFAGLLGLLAALAVHAGVAPTPVENFFKSYSYADMALSPSGRYLGVLYPSNETSNIAVIDLDDKHSLGITNYAKTGRVTWLGWKSDERLIFGLKAMERGLYRYSVNSIRRDGSDLYTVAPDSGLGIISWLHNDANHILFSAQGRQADHVRALRVFVGNHDNSIPFGEKLTTEVMLVQAPHCRYIADNDGEVRVCTTWEPDGSSRILYRDLGAASWRQIAVTSATGAGFKVLGFTRDNKQLYVLSNENRDTLALYEFNPTEILRKQTCRISL